MDRKLRAMIEERAMEGEGRFAIALALIDMADGQEAIAGALQRLGNGNAATHFGAIEAHGIRVAEVAESIDRLASSVSEVASCIPSEN